MSNALVPFTPPITFPNQIIPISGNTPNSSGTVPLSRTFPLSNSVTSCGTPGGSQYLCGNYAVNFALYLSTGGEIGVPGTWCLECGFGGGSNGGEEYGSGSDLTTEFASDTGSSSDSLGSSNPGDPTGESSNPGETLPQDEVRPINFSDNPEIASNFPGDYLAGKAPRKVQPGIRILEGQYMNDLGQVEPWKAYYDEYGRIIARTDYTLGNQVAAIPPIHHHLFRWDIPYEVNGLELPDHWPGEYTP